MRNILTILAAAAVLGACAQKSAYEAAVEDYEPVYCYQSLGGVTCYEKPNFRDERRKVNYFGPAPKRYDRPEPAPAPELFAPKPVNYWVKDPEPIPRAAPLGDLTDRPWIGAPPAPEAAPPVIREGDAVSQAPAVQPAPAAAPATPVTAAEESSGLQAFLKRLVGDDPVPETKAQ
ncbi:MAG: hypothetical protein OXR84_08350 [Magnetovibrio sp.]|nr:hypothetical protein [Magnetovibrio sp.]